MSGATGHLGFNLVGELLAHGYRVRAGVRDPDDARRTHPLRALNARLVRCELFDPVSLAHAIDGVTGVFHVAALTRMWARDPQKEIIEPNVEGVLNVLAAAVSAGVRRVVLTSSVAAIGSTAPADRPLDESQWNDRPGTPYAAAKTEAERRAWQFARERGLDLVVLNPSSLVGPGYFRHTPMSWLVEAMIRGYVRFSLPSSPAWVDVRDVAAAHRVALERREVEGRYLLSTACLSFGDFANMLHQIDPTIPRVRRTMPNFAMRLVAAFDYLGHRTLGLERRLTGEILDEFIGAEMHCSTSKAQQDLDWKPRSLRDTAADTIAWVRRERQRFQDGRP